MRKSPKNIRKNPSTLCGREWRVNLITIFFVPGRYKKSVPNCVLQSWRERGKDLSKGFNLGALCFIDEGLFLVGPSENEVMG